MSVLARFSWMAGVVVSLAGTGACAAIDFARDVAPILSQHCAECHGPNVQKGKVSLSQRTHLLGEGDWKKVLIPGQPQDSDLIKVISGDEPEMPKKGAKLSEAEVGTLRQWIAEGAFWPEDYTLKEAISAADRLWSLKPIVRPLIPAGSSPNPIDRFIDQSLATAKLTSADAADPRTLIRRLSFDLLGLPPKPQEVDAFVAECTEDSSLVMRDSSWERLVSRLLASPYYGERWARHWLDIAHYADTHGFERDQKRENAWPYRDWVIEAFNKDMPYDQFLRMQLAGDVIAPEDRAAVIATGFLAAGPWDFVGQMETPSPVLKRQARADDLDDMVTQVITSTLGLTINCARCHNHKLDPIPQEDYYRLIACFAGVKRGERDLDPPQAPGASRQRRELAARIAELEKKVAQLSGEALNLANVVGAGTARGEAKPGFGFDPGTGKAVTLKQGFISNAEVNVFHAVTGKEGADPFPMIDGVVIPDGRSPVPISTTGLTVTDVPRTSGKAWDAIRNGPVNAQASTVLHGIDFNSPGHTLLGMHANAAVTFDLTAAHAQLGAADLRFTALAGYGGAQADSRADFHLYVDGKLMARHMKIGKADGGILINIALPSTARFLTLMSTDGGDGIAHDQIFLGDPLLSLAEPTASLNEAQRRDLEASKNELDALRKMLQQLPKPGKLYAAVSEPAPAIHVLSRGSPEAPLQQVTPGVLSCIALPSSLGEESLPEGERRKRLAEWITDKRNPLTARVMANRLWHHHFGRGLVDTPSDFGHGGGKPSHPELLDWLADEFMRSGWSVKHMQRLMVTSEAYRRASTAAASVDSSNRLLARMNPRRLDAESFRDAVLSVSGCLNLTSGGPGYQDFSYQEAYAPIYQHITADRPELWRRSIYRFVVRTTPQRFLTTLDCPNPANLTPARLTTTTALQSLALMNNEFMLRQAEYFAQRVQREARADIGDQVKYAFRLAFQRQPDLEEWSGALALARQQGLAALCRVLWNANEFVHID